MIIEIIILTIVASIESFDVNIINNLCISSIILHVFF